jgi:hypothetical protein
MTASEPSSPGAAPLSNDSREPGLWLWQGGEAPPHSDAPPPASPARPPSRVERIADFVGSAARWARRMGPASGWFLIGLAAFVMAHALPGGEPMPRNMPAAAPQPVPAPSAALPASSTSPAGVPVAQLGQLSEPSGAIAKRMAGRNQHIPAKWLASRRSRLVVRRAYPFLVYRSAPVFREPCRYQCDDGSEVTTWHGGGY